VNISKEDLISYILNGGEKESQYKFTFVKIIQRDDHLIIFEILWIDEDLIDCKTLHYTKDIRNILKFIRNRKLEKINNL